MPFIREQYRDAARQHLTACRRLLEAYPEWSKLCNKLDEEKILHEIYYISGYVLEGFVNYVIFCHPTWNPDDDCQNINRNSEFFEQTKLMYRGDNKKVYILCAHNFHKNKEIIHKLRHVSGIPYLCPDAELAEEKEIADRLDTLIRDWRPEIRYKKISESEALSIDDMRNLIKLCKRISDGIRCNCK